MKHSLNKILSCTLAFLVLFSTLSFTVEKHYCGDFLMDVSFTGDASDCGMNMKKTKKKCCKDELHHIEGQDQLQQFSIEDFDIKKQQFLVVFVKSYQDLLVRYTLKNTTYKDFPPPDNPFNYQVQYQSFLI